MENCKTKLAGNSQELSCWTDISIRWDHSTFFLLSFDQLTPSTSLSFASSALVSQVPFCLFRVCLAEASHFHLQRVANPFTALLLHPFTFRRIHLGKKANLPPSSSTAILCHHLSFLSFGAPWLLFLGALCQDSFMPSYFKQCKVKSRKRR